MKPIKIAFLSLILISTLLWWQAGYGEISLASGVFAWRSLMIQYSGILTFAAMSTTVFLAIRSRGVERLLGGVDKMYRLHKWLGITVLLLSIVHWLWVKAPKWLAQAGWLVRPERDKVPEESVAIFRFFHEQRELAEQLGEWAFYGLIVLIALALIKRIPYREFYKIHRWMALIYIPLLLHSMVLMKFQYWSLPIGSVMAILMLAGTFAALVSLFKRIGINRMAVGVIEEIEYLGGVQINSVLIQLKTRWAGHKAGQFAFVTFHQTEGAHPFTISSAWRGDGKILLLIKALGDYTKTLATRLKPGDLVQIEGPYGCFNFNGDMPRQIWIGGGVGVTPFIARMKFLVLYPDGKQKDFFYSARRLDNTALQNLTQDADDAWIKLHTYIQSTDGILTGEKLRTLIPDWQSADIWFCGPSAFGQAIRNDLIANGLTAKHFHQELFEMR